MALLLSNMEISPSLIATYLSFLFRLQIKILDHTFTIHLSFLLYWISFFRSLSFLDIVGRGYVLLLVLNETWAKFEIAVQECDEEDLDWRRKFFKLLLFLLIANNSEHKCKSLYHFATVSWCVYTYLPESDFYIHKVSVFSSVINGFALLLYHG
jgi:hypothetical protein